MPASFISGLLAFISSIFCIGVYRQGWVNMTPAFFDNKISGPIFVMIALHSYNNILYFLVSYEKPCCEDKAFFIVMKLLA